MAKTRGLPAPEREQRELAEREANMPRALHDVIAGAHQRRATKREDDAEGVVGANAAEREPGNIEVQYGPRELRSCEHADGHADDTPDGRSHQEHSDHVVIVRFFCGHRIGLTGPRHY